jgi:hypothetical protein
MQYLLLSTASMVARTRLNITLYVDCLSCVNIKSKENTNERLQNASRAEFYELQWNVLGIVPFTNGKFNIFWGPTLQAEYIIQTDVRLTMLLTAAVQKFVHNVFRF